MASLQATPTPISSTSTSSLLWHDRAESNEIESPKLERLQLLPFFRFSKTLTIWRYEILLYFLAVAANIALVVLLARVDHSRQVNWAGSPITLNTLVSVLATIIRASIAVPVTSALLQQKWLRYHRNGPREMRSGPPLSDYIVYDAASRGFMGSAQLLWVTRLG